MGQREKEKSEAGKEGIKRREGQEEEGERRRKNFQMPSLSVSLFSSRLSVENALNMDVNDLYAELEIMKKMEPHPNILNLLGYCTRPCKHSVLCVCAFREVFDQMMFVSFSAYLVH